MPYRIKGKTIWSKSGGKWHKKQTAKSVANAKKAMGLLMGLEMGSIKPSEVGKGKYAKKPAKKPQNTKNRTMAYRASMRLSKSLKRA